MKTEIEKAIKTLTEKSKDAKFADEALKFSQSASNLAHAFQTFQHAEKEK